MFARYSLILFVGLGLPLRADIGIRLLLGVTDTEVAKWDGSIRVAPGRVTRIDPWRFGKADEVTGPSSWRVSTAPAQTFYEWIDDKKGAVAENGVIVWLTGEEETTEISVDTVQGNFAFRLSDIPYGKFHHALDGRVAIDRIPASKQLTRSPEEQDYPAAAMAPNGDVWLAYLEFRHNPEHDRIRVPYKERPKSFADLTAPTGGDQVFVQRFSNDRWSEPIAVTPPGGDLYRPTVAVDGSGRTWVFWSANKESNFDLWARVFTDGKPGKTIQITNAPGADVFPVATRDAKGRVWVAWQGWRDGKAVILAAVQSGNSFSTPEAVSQSAANEWNPAIASDPQGRVTVAWDTYRNGNYDVYVRTATEPGTWSAEVPAAASARYEAYPSIAYDKQGTLWIAYEEGSEGWGKDFGAHRSTGVPVYYARAVRLIGIDSSGRRLEPEADVAAVIPGPSAVRAESERRQADATGWETPDPQTFTRRPANAHIWPANNPRNSLPRLLVDASGRIWLVFRSNHPAMMSPLGSVWSEYVASFDGKVWTGPIFLFRSDNLLDNRPALVSQKSGQLIVVTSSDYRREGQYLARGGLDFDAESNHPVLKDPYNNDLYASVLSLAPAAGVIAGRVAGPLPAPAAVVETARERTQIAAMHDWRIDYQGSQMKILRGEFHRHSEISSDGGLDGSLIDQWRYVIDAASLDWVGCCDHDNGDAREYSWWTTQKLTDIFYSPGRFVPMFSYERSVEYPEGHRNVVFARRGVRPLPRLPKVAENSSGHAPDTLMFYDYLKQFGGIAAAHTSATEMGTDWRDNDPQAEPVVEIYQGMRQNYEAQDRPRSNHQEDSIGGWRPKGFVNLALEKGYKLGFQASSDHISTHQSHAVVFATDDTREAILDALRQRHVYAATDNILADVRSGSNLMGDVFSSAEAPNIHVELEGTSKFAKVVIVKDNEYVYSTQPDSAKVEFSWRDNAPASGKTSYYYIRGEQDNGEIVWTSPMWITYTGR